MATQESIVISGSGMIVSSGTTLDTVWTQIKTQNTPATPEAYSLKGFRADQFLSDRRMMKAISPTHAIGLAAVELVGKNIGFRHADYDPWRLGMFVGAPQGSLLDNKNYIPALEASVDAAGEPSARIFGKESMHSRPVTLLEGLPNNVLCYGSIVLDSRGANSNYTSAEISGHLALINAVKRIERGQVDAICAGGFSGATEPYTVSTFRQRGWLRDDTATREPYRIAFDEGEESGTVLADGAVFHWIERESLATKGGRRSRLICHGGDTYGWGTGPAAPVGQPEELAERILHFLTRKGVRPEDIGLVFVSGSGLALIDTLEAAAMRTVWADLPAPSFATTSVALGNLMEASGLVEIALAPQIYDDGKLPSLLDARQLNMPLGSSENECVEATRRLVLVVRSSFWGESSFVLVEVLEAS